MIAKRNRESRCRYSKDLAGIVRRSRQVEAQAKVFASEVAIQNSLRAMQVHGGYGYSTEYEIERLYRDAPLMSIGEGTNDIMRMVIAKQIFAD